MKKILLLLSASLICLTQVDAQISVARTAPLNSTVTITGRVLNGSELGSIRYIGDSTAAMAAYGSNLRSVLRGDSITVTAT